MNCEPCNSLEVTCNHNVTIGYLKELVAIIPTGCCTTITVTGDDTYCPTYGELMNGSIIPVFVDGGDNAWSNNVDGITISGSYSANQIVAKKDLSLIYTAFESLVISNSSPIVSECGGSTTTTRTLTFRKYTKKCNETATSTTQADTTLTITWSGTDSTSTGTKTYARNTSFSNTHSSTVSCSISWRGCSYTSNSIIVSQKVREFDHYVYYPSSTTYYTATTGVDVTVSPWNFQDKCDGPHTAYATASYTYHYWRDRESVDTCDVHYNYESEWQSGNSSGSLTPSWTSKTIDSCADYGGVYHTETATASKDGYSDSDWAAWSCSNCEGCPDKEEYEFSSGSVDKCGNWEMSGYKNVSSYTEQEDGSCVYSTSSHTSTSDSGKIDPNETSQEISVSVTSSIFGTHTLTQAAGPCTVVCSCSDLSVGSSSESWAYNDTTSKDITITSASCITDISVNSLTHFNATLGSSKVTVSPKGNNTSESDYSETLTVSYKADGTSCTKDITLTQTKQTITCACSDLSVGSTSETWEYNVTTSRDISITSANCITDISVNSPTHFNATLGSSKVTVSPKGNNTSTTEYNDTLTVSYKASGTNCTKDITLKQKKQECVTGYSASLSNMDVTCLEVDGVRQDFTLTSTTLVNGVCTTNTTPYSNKKVYFAADGQGAVIPRNDSTSTVTTPITLWYNPNTDQFFSFNHNNVSVQVNGGGFSVTQAAGPCCSPGTDDYTMGSEHHILDLPAESGRSAHDTNRCGFDLTKCSISHYSGPSFTDWTIESSTRIKYTTNSANPDLTSRTEVLKITTTATSVGDCGLPICSEWYVEIRQSGDMCGCHRVNVNVGGHLGGAVGSTLTVNWNGGGCAASDDSSWYWCDASGNKISNPPSWIAWDTGDWSSTDGWERFKAVEANNTGAVRVAYARFEILMWNQSSGVFDDCGHTAELYQDPV